MSVSVGAPGLTLNLSPRGHAVTVGLPGTGLSYRHSLRAPLRTSTGEAPPPRLETSPTRDPAPGAQSGQISSADIAQLTSPDLAGLKQLFQEAAQQHAALEPDYQAALKSRQQAWRRLRRREQPPLRLFFKNAIPRAQEAFAAAEEELLKVAAARAQSEVRIDLPLNAEAAAAHRALMDAHAELARSARIWDVTASVGVDRVRERSFASSAVSRTPIRLSRVTDAIVASAEPGLRFQNANGADLDFFPGLLLMRSRDGRDYALVDLRDLQVAVRPRAFVEEEVVPADSQVVDQAWAKANRDGSRDRRFNDNRQIPVVRYGEILFTTPDGVAEAFHASNCEAALAFGAAFHELQAALARQAQSGPERGGADAAADPPAPERVIALPRLASIGGAHEYTVAALLALCVGGWQLLPSPPSPQPKPTEAPRLALEPPRTIAEPPSSVRPDSRPAVPPEPPASAAPASAPERVTTVRNANLRQRPEQASPVARVLSAGTSLTVYGRQGSWIQVGDAQEQGWVHASVVRTAP
ncbi:DUF4236 domain-containing protein [Methylobacterium sp. WL9]|nr:DUF4236 domain-containing protein [Methylobacterium sp. WL9]